jgi:hypothetical protein
MPFISQSLRKVIDTQGLNGLLAEGWSIQPGDRCYFFYKQMVDRWKANPRWTTAHEIYKELMYTPLNGDIDEDCAKELAWQVFFINYVMPYEDVREEINGTI